MKWQTRIEKSSLFKFLGSESLSGDLTVVEGSPGIVLFAHGSGRHSRRNRYVAKVLQDTGLGTLLFDLQKRKR